MLSSNVDNAPGPADGEATNVDLRNLKSMSIKGFFVSPATVTVNTNVNDVDDMGSYDIFLIFTLSLFHDASYWL